MSSNRSSLIRVVAALALAAGLGGCVTHTAETSHEHGPTPTENFAVRVAPHEDQIFLAPHGAGLSPNQGAALHALVERWRDPGGAVIKIQTPARGGEEVYRATASIQGALYSLGVRPDQVRMSDYEADEGPNGPIIVGFTRYEAEVPVCGRDWGNFTGTSENRVSNNFGCAVTANMAAMIADPHDLITPRPAEPGDNTRREVVMGKYRQGEVSSTAKDPQADGSVSSIGR